jgi:phosphoglycerate kinase
VELFNKKTIKDIDLKGKRVLLRADYNVPVKNGRITDDYRIKQSLPTIQYIWEQYQSSLVIISHLGRPDGKPDKALSLVPVANRLGELLGKKVKFATGCVGDEAKKMADELKPGEILLLENVRFYPGEEKNDPAFAKQIVEASGAQVFVQDGFGVVHRAHATTDAITKLLPAVAGLLLATEVETITKVMEDPQHPLVAVIGGAKISDKIDFLNRLIELADCVAVTGAMANDFLLAQGTKVGNSLVEKGVIDTAQEVLERARKAALRRPFNFLVPVDAVVSKKMDGTAPTRVVDLFSHSLADIEAYPKIPKPAAYTVGADEIILDIGPISAAGIGGVIKSAKTVIWNGPCGMTEVKGIAGAHSPFAHGTRIVVDAMIGAGPKDKNKPFSLVGGGDTAAYVASEGLMEDFNFVSTGGGASLDLMSGHKLPGVEALLDK